MREREREREMDDVMQRSQRHTHISSWKEEDRQEEIASQGNRRERNVRRSKRRRCGSKCSTTGLMQ
jgi:hypothetical protein